MPVLVSLELIASNRVYAALLPKEFVAFTEKFHTHPDERTGWLVLADWLAECDETDMEAACRWMAKHPEVKLEYGNYSGKYYWDGLPTALDRPTETNCSEFNNYPEAIVELTRRLRRAREEVA